MPLIVFEGLDGSGKTTLIRRLTEILDTQYQLTVVQVTSLGSSTIGPQLRELFLVHQGLTNWTRIGLSLANLAQTHLEIIHPALAQSQLVLADRWLASTYAYQIYGTGLTWSSQQFQQWLAPWNFALPTATCYLKIDPCQGLWRKKPAAEDQADWFEQQPISYFQRVQQGYQQFYQDILPVASYDATLPIAALVDQILTWLQFHQLIPPIK
jgi:dTMP kinase